MKTTKPDDYEQLLRYTREEMDVYEANHPWKYKYPRLFRRFIIRSVRIAAGGIVSLFAVASCNKLTSYSDRKLAGLEVGDIAAMIFLPIATFFIFKWAFGIAFGAGEDREQIEKERRQKATEKLDELMPEIRRQQSCQ